jgi:two-component system phosphate regulon response regulator PhoB
VRGIEFIFNSQDALLSAMRAGADERELALTCSDGLRDGEWVLATFVIGAETVSVAARAYDRGGPLGLVFEERDWQQLCELAGGRNCRCSGRASAQMPAVSVEPPPNSRVLLVDDDPDVQQVVSCMLRAKGFAVTAVSSAEEAYDHVRRSDVDLMVLDWNLPGMSGLDLVRQLRRELTLARLPVLFLTAHASSHDVEEAFTAGADDFVSKPFRAPELGARIIGLLRRSAPESALR